MRAIFFLCLCLTSLIAAGAALVGCPQSEIDICYGAACSGADGAAADGQVAPPGCDLAADPKDSFKCVDDEIAYFVSGSGSDANNGTKASPLQTIGAAVAKAGGQRNRVYVCDGVYGESVKVTTGVSIYGGFGCDFNSYSGTPTQVGPHGSGVTLSINAASAGLITVQDLSIVSANGAKPGDSSVAIFVASSTVAFKRVTATAGDGSTGADSVVLGNYASAAAASGVTATGNDGADAGDCSGACTDGTESSSGRGGSGGPGGGLPGAAGGPSIAENPAGLNPPHNGRAGACGTIFPGPGADGPVADGGAAGAASSGTLTSDGWTRSDGRNGLAGFIAQGGGGGGGATSNDTKGGGGSGGCGGCGGGSGKGGMSGGSSFALLAYKSSITLDTCTLHAGNGGAGKVGGGGQVGQLGGTAGKGVALGDGCNAAPGGNGGAGSGGGGGAGGSAIAVGYVGTKPTMIGGSMGEGASGADGGAGPGGNGNNGAPGALGVRGDTVELE